MLKHTISISCCFEVAVVAFFLFLFFCFTKSRKKLELDLTQVNKTDKASFSYFLAIYHQYFQRSRSLCDVSFTKSRKKLELDLTQVNKTDKASFSYFLAIYHQYFQRSRSLCDVSFTKPLCMEKSSSSSLDFTTYFTVFHHPYINIAYSYF